MSMTTRRLATPPDSPFRCYHGGRYIASEGNGKREKGTRRRPCRPDQDPLAFAATSQIRFHPRKSWLCYLHGKLQLTLASNFPDALSLPIGTPSLNPARLFPYLFPQKDRGGHHRHFYLSSLRLSATLSLHPKLPFSHARCVPRLPSLRTLATAVIVEIHFVFLHRWIRWRPMSIPCTFSRFAAAKYMTS